MNIFLDSNILFPDPFFKENFARNFLKTIKEIDGKIFISNVVYQEVINNYKREFKKRRKTFGEAHFELNKIVVTSVEHTFKDDEFYLSELIDFYQNMIKDGHLIIIPHTEFDMFNEIVQRALNNKKPFDYQKEEFKDTVIWLTYSKYVEKHGISGYFLSNNTKEFYASDKESIHPDLLADTERLVPYKSIEKFLTSNSDNIKDLITEKEEERSFTKLLNWANSNLNESYVEKVIKEEFMEELQSELSFYIDDLSEVEINNIINDYRYNLSKLESITLLNTSLNTFEREIYGSEIIIYGSLDVKHFVSLYLWNLIRDKGESPYFPIGNETITHTIEFTFSINGELNAANFEVKDIETLTKTNNSMIKPEEILIDPEDIVINPEEVF